jgi:hypothetical protein
MYIECRHIFPNGKKCESPALRKQDFCFFHHNKRNRQSSSKRSGQPSTVTHHLPQLEDGDAIGLALSDVVLALAANRIDPRRAQILIYGLQVASTHFKQLSLGHNSRSVREAYQHPDGSLVGVQLQCYDFGETHNTQMEDDEEEDNEEDNDSLDNQPEKIDACHAAADPLAIHRTEEELQHLRPARRALSPAPDTLKAELEAEADCTLSQIHAVAVRASHRAAKKSKTKFCRTFPNSTEAPLLPPNPPLPLSHVRQYAQNAIARLFPTPEEQCSRKSGSGLNSK